MKNFTNNFKQFTSRLSARWLIMVLMLLLGTSSAWAAKLRGTLPGSDWNNGIQVNDNVGISINLDAGSTYEFKLFDDSQNKWFRDQYAGTMKRDNCTNWEFNYEGDGNTKIYADISGTYIFTFKWSNSKAYLTVTYPAQCASCCTNYYLQHPWNGGNWTWKELKKEDCNNNIYTLTANYGNAGCDYSKPGVQEKDGYIANPTIEGSPAKGDECIFKFDANNKSITITKVVKCNSTTYSISFANNVTSINKGATVQASVSPNSGIGSVTWSSETTSVATISSAGLITGKGYGTSTITATVADGDTYCGGTATKTITVKETPTISISGETTFCGTSTTLTANIGDLTDGNTAGKTITWYKDGGASSVGTGPTYNATATGTYTAKITGTYINETTSTGFSVTKKATPTVTNFTYEAPSDLTYSNSTKSATVGWNGTQGGAITVKYSSTSNSYTAATPEDAGTYYVFVSTVENDNYCAVTDLYINTFKIAPAEQTDFSITNSSYSICGKSVTVTAAGGQSDGAITYSITTDNTSTKDASIDVNTGVLTVKSAGEVSVKAQRAGTTNYQPITDNATFNFTMPIENVNLSIIKGLSASGDYCVGTEIQLQLTYTGATPANDGNHFEWVTDGFSSEIGNNEGGIATGATWTTTLGVNDKTLKVKLKDCNEGWVESNELTFNVFERPEAPKFNPNYMTVCQGEAFTLPGSEPEGYIWSDALGKPTTANKPNGIDATTDYYAVISFGCPSPATKYTVTVNPLPTISSISASNDKPVLFEDVVLTANNVTNGAQVNWYVGENLVAENTNTYTVTSETAGEVIVKAKAFLNGCESAVATKTVTFGAEDCGNIGSNNSIIITCDPGTYAGDLYCYIFGATTPKGWSECKGTKTNGIWKWEFNNINEGDHSLIFHSNSKSNNKDCKTGDLNHKLQRGYQYDYALNGVNSKWCNEPHPTIDPVSGKKLQTITAPAVKTVSVNSEQGSGVVNFTGQIIKTGCAAASKIYYGYQFKKADEEWPTSGIEASNTPEVGKLIPCTNASATALNYQFSANVEGLEDGDYHFRAYIINGYNFTNGNYDQGVYYGLDKLVTVSTVKVPVSLAKIELTALDGTPVEPGHKYCIGSPAYIKVTSDVKYTTATWKSDLGVEIVPTRTTNIYQFIVKGNDEIVVLLSNKFNSEPVSSEPISVEVYASASVPEIALGASSICDTNEDGTTLTVTRTKAGQYYALYKEDGNGGTLVEDYQLCSTDDAEIEFTGLKEAAKYFVKTYTSECRSAISVTSSTTLTVVDSKNVKISIEPTSTETTPWMPVKLTVTATSDYTVTSDPNDAVINISGNIVKVKLPLPTEGVSNKGTTENDVNVTFTDVPYTITAELKTAGEEGNPCAQPAIANITLKPYIEICD